MAEVIQPVPCPLITPYTGRIVHAGKVGIDPGILEKLYYLRNWDLENGEPIPFKWPTHLRRHIYSVVHECITTQELIPRNYQLQQAHHLSRMPRFICGDAVGLGKTLDAIISAAWLQDRLPKQKVIVMTTKSTTEQWADEFRRFSTLRPHVMQDKYGKKKSYEARYQQLEDFLTQDNHDVMICKYSSMKGTRKKIEGPFDEDGRPVVDGKERISSEIKRFASILAPHGNCITLILDESHKFKSTLSQMRVMVQVFERPCARVWAMTATAIKNSLDEFYSIASAIGIRPFGFMTAFRDEFCLYRDVNVGKGRTKRVLTGYRNIPKFRNGMRPFFFGRSQAQVKEPLPKLTTMIHPIDLDDEQTRLLLHDIPSGAFQLPPSLKKVHGEWVEKDRSFDNEMTALSVYQLVANHPALLDPRDTKFLTKTLSPKEECLLDMLDGDYQGEKVICFAQPLEAKVLTPSGWRLMGELRVGDPVIDPDGGVAHVEGVYPQGLKPVFEVTTKTGARTECCGDHLWTLQTYSDQRKKLGRWRTYSTDKIQTKPLLRTNKNGSQHYRYFLPIPEPTNFEPLAITLPIEPYILGVLLGDGDITRSVTFVSFDVELADRVERLLPPDLRLGRGSNGTSFGISSRFESSKDERGYNLPGVNPYLNALRELDVLGMGSATKSIPLSYKLASVSERIELIRGLLDTDGTCHRQHGQAHFASCSQSLAHDFAEVVRSVGGLATVYGPYPSFYTHKGEKKRGLPHWQVYIRTHFNPFHLERKAEVWRRCDVNNPIRSIKSIGVKECQCIRVSSKRSLYITDDYLVTHNTKYRTWIDRLEALTEKGAFTDRKFLRITGAESEKKRGDSKRKFQDPDGGYDLIVINSAATEGVNLQQAAHLVCLDIPWSWGDMLQLVGRMVRMASPHSACTLHIMCAKGSIDEYAIETLKGKKGLFEAILGESHSAGILDDKAIHDLTSGMEHVPPDEDFEKLMKAHAKSVGMKTFLEGEQLSEAVADKEYKMTFEPGAKKKPKRIQREDDDIEDLYTRWS